jgi:hypothetical protein
VSIPALLNEKILGFKFTNALAGATTFAAIFVVKVAKMTPIKDRMMGKKPPIKLSTSIGSEIGRPNMTTVADVTARPTKVNAAMNKGRPIA